MKATGKLMLPPYLWLRASMVLIEGQPAPDRRSELRELFEHRAAIAEYHGELTREEAERLAFRELRQELGLLH